MKIKEKKTGEVVEAWNPSTEPEPGWFVRDSVSDLCIRKNPDAIWRRQGSCLVQILAFDDEYEVVS